MWTEPRSEYFTILNQQQVCHIQNRNRCTFTPASGMLRTGLLAEGLSRLTGAKPPSSQPTETCMLMHAPGPLAGVLARRRRTHGGTNLWMPAQPRSLDGSVKIT